MTAAPHVMPDTNPDSTAQAQPRPWWRRPLTLLLVLAVLLRLWSMTAENFPHADEVWQYLEPAHRLVFGRWVVAWEFREGIRTWLIPAMLAPWMWLGNALAPASGLYLVLPRLFLILLSLVVVVSSYLLGARISRLHGWMAGFVTAIWAELVYYAPHALSESVALALFMAAAALLLGNTGQRSAARLAIAGALLGLCFSVRFQFAPALGVLALFVCRARWRDWCWLALGGLAGLGIDAAVDLFVAGQPPLRWILVNFRINLLEGKSATFGTEPAWWYLARLVKMWRVALLLIIPLAVLSARRYPALMAVALVNLIAHMVIPHKEYRFILLSAVILVVLAALGTADLVRKYAQGNPRKLSRISVWACVFWALASLLVAFNGSLRKQWDRGRGLIEAMELAAGPQAPACALALVQPPHPLTATYVFYHRDTPIYLFNGPADRADALRYQQAFDTVLSDKLAPALSADYALVGCTSGSYCIYRRPGTCTGEVPGWFEVNRQLQQLGK